jgi:hypothetical protein
MWSETEDILFYTQFLPNVTLFYGFKNRMAIRRTWLQALPESLDSDSVAARFFIGLPLTSSTSTATAVPEGAEVKEDDPEQLAVAAEALEFGDVAFLNLADRYMATLLP